MCSVQKGRGRRAWGRAIQERKSCKGLTQPLEGPGEAGSLAGAWGPGPEPGVLLGGPGVGLGWVGREAGVGECAPSPCHSHAGGPEPSHRGRSRGRGPAQAQEPQTRLAGKEENVVIGSGCACPLAGTG